MKHVTHPALRVLGSILWLMASTIGAGPAEGGKHLFIPSGQSHMVGMDPAVSFTPAVTGASAKEPAIGRISDNGPDRWNRLSQYIA